MDKIKIRPSTAKKFYLFISASILLCGCASYKAQPLEDFTQQGCPKQGCSKTEQ